MGYLTRLRHIILNPFLALLQICWCVTTDGWVRDKMLWMWWFFLGCQSKLKQPQKLAFKITIKDTSNEVKLNQSFFSPLGFAMILLQGWNHFWKAITMKRSIKEVATMASGKNMEMSARNATAASSCGKTFASFVSTS